MTSSDVGEFFSSADGNAAEPPLPSIDGRRRPVRAGVRHVGGCRCDEDDALGIAAVDADVVGYSTDDDEEDCERNDKRRMACGGIGGDDQRRGMIKQRPNITSITYAP
jgi:hypothetical protein